MKKYLTQNMQSGNFNYTNKIEEELFMKRTKIYNLIILDKSGSMFDIRQAAINGFNETLGSIQAAQKKYLESQEHYVTFVTFCGCGIQKVYDNVPVGKTHKITSEQYEPCCSTPLYDAIGFTLSKMKKVIKDDEDSTAIVTIITDGEENSSEEYNLPQVQALIHSLKEEGWTFAYMGTCHDVKSVTTSLSITNVITFERSEENTAEVFKQDREARERFYCKIDKLRAAEPIGMPSCGRKASYRKIQDEYFDNDENK